MFFRLIWIILLLPLPAMAAWTGIAAFVGNSESDWLQSTQLNRANIDFLGLRIEEKTEVELRVGATAGVFDLRLLNPLIVTAAEKYHGEFLSLYLRWPIRLTDRIKFHSKVKYQLNRGDKSAELENTEIDWTEVSVSAGLSLRLARLSIRPFVSFRSIDGDITSSAQTRIFQQDTSESHGLMLDYVVERSAFVRLMVSTGSNRAVLMSFAREY